MENQTEEGNRKYELQQKLIVGAKIKIGVVCAQKAGTGFKAGKVITLVEGWFERDNGLYVSDISCPSVWNKGEEDFDSIYHLFGNDLENFYDCEIVGFKHPAKSFKCYNCGSRSVNKGAFYGGSNKHSEGRVCLKCEKEFERQNREDNAWYDSVRM